MNELIQHGVIVDLESIAKYLKQIVEKTENANIDYKEGGLVPVYAADDDTMYKDNSQVLINSVEENEELHTIIDSIVDLPQFEEDSSVDFTTGLIEPIDGDLRIIKSSVEVEKIETYFVECDYTTFESQDALRKFKDEINVVEEKADDNKYILKLESGATLEMNVPHEYDSSDVFVGYIHIKNISRNEMYDIRAKLYNYTSNRKSERYDGWFNIIEEPNV